MNLNNFRNATNANKQYVIKRICDDNKHLPMFDQRFSTMDYFSVTRSLNKSADIFSYDAGTSKLKPIVGYRVQHVNGRFVAEPWVFLTENPSSNTAIEINTRTPNSLYFGTLVPDELIKYHGLLAYSILLGNLDLLKRYSLKPVSL